MPPTATTKKGAKRMSAESDCDSVDDGIVSPRNASHGSNPNESHAISASKKHKAHGSAAPGAQGVVVPDVSISTNPYFSVFVSDDASFITEMKDASTADDVVKKYVSYVGDVPEPLVELFLVEVSKRFTQAKSTTGARHFCGDAVIIMAMRKFPTNVALQRKGCCALGNRSWHFDSGKEIVDLGGIDVVVSALQRFPFDAGMQNKGLTALTNILSYENVQERNEIIRVILAPIKRFHNDEEVVVRAVRALKFCLRVAEMNAGVLETGCVELTIEAMKLCPLNQELQINSCDILFALSIFGKQAIDSMITAKALSTIGATLENHCNQERVCHYAKKAFLALTSSL